MMISTCTVPPKRCAPMTSTAFWLSCSGRNRRLGGIATLESEGGELGSNLILYVHDSMSKRMIARTVPCTCGKHDPSEVPAKPDLRRLHWGARSSSKRLGNEVSKPFLRIGKLREILLARGETALAKRILRPMTAEEAVDVGFVLMSLGFLCLPESADQLRGRSKRIADEHLRWMGNWYGAVGEQGFGVQVEEE